MPRHLVSKYPCRDCAAPTSVRSTKEIPGALCSRCYWRRNAWLRIHGKYHRSQQLAAEGNAAAHALKEPMRSRRMLICWLRSLAQRLEGAALALELQEHFAPFERRRLAQRVVDELGCVSRHIANLAPWTERLADLLAPLAVEVLPGGGREGEQRPAPPPSLRLVPKDGGA